MNEGMIKFHNLHLPNEVRVFQIPESNIRVWNDSVMVYEVKFEDEKGENLTFRHYSFYKEWFEINITLDAAGKLITESGPIEWSFNCDICSPCYSKGVNVYNVDLELDILVRSDGKEYIVIDEDDFAQVVSQGLLSEDECIGARKGLESLLQLISSGRLISFLEDICPFADLIRLSDPIPGCKLQLSDVPLLGMPERGCHYGRRE
ncbi:YgaC family protein [Paenibacillus spongiae]|uniref:YgaC family protein n=1 Tax=Paenibacillus spongiae TaxID=2909671 RepID=A0ABY5SAU1_9BACL|nr:YgaC family protein [Paenibacillus spongiae]UVI29413.1 YgaC family protein [Paenibacillus spongiae]